MAALRAAQPLAPGQSSARSRLRRSRSYRVAACPPPDRTVLTVVRAVLSAKSSERAFASSRTTEE
ncbi:hypothetical protein Natpe_2736 [Natrinema pellirubrum DSM 15624]|uniref:Uncharacterized protein n=1 Tax=Natrinema pellirubrum (strain DSM 15624 / CIP 106293 / JCM 10476 / NCIMB 786 / 157) TaxID=797303 RepID=L0JNW9_NATP1|nr:hypothetical protein Natpe_2736 [Natrinema pellirubrum DSM 15624]